MSVKHRHCYKLKGEDVPFCIKCGRLKRSGFKDDGCAYKENPRYHHRWCQSTTKGIKSNQDRYVICSKCGIKRYRATRYNKQKQYTIKCPFSGLEGAIKDIIE